MFDLYSFSEIQINCRFGFKTQLEIKMQNAGLSNHILCAEKFSCFKRQSIGCDISRGGSFMDHVRIIPPLRWRSRFKTRREDLPYFHFHFHFQLLQKLTIGFKAWPILSTQPRREPEPGPAYHYTATRECTRKIVCGYSSP